MPMHRKNKDSGASNFSYDARWFSLSVIRRRKRNQMAKISRRVKGFTRKLMKKARKSYLKRNGFLAQQPIPNRGRREKMRGHDGTMYGPYRSRGM